MKKETKPTCSPSKISNNLQNKTDFFGAKINFNFDGREKITSLPGSLISIALGIAFLCYAAMKFEILILQLNATVTETMLGDYFD